MVTWTSNVVRDPRVRIKIGDKWYEATMVLVADRSQAIALLCIAFSRGTSRSTAAISHPRVRRGLFPRISLKFLRMP
jgi:hypothetical protein